MKPWEKKILQQPNVEAVAKCIQSGFFIREKADDYLDKILKTMPFYKELAIASNQELVNFEKYRNSNDYSVFSKEHKVLL